MVTDNHYRWDFIGLSTDTKPTPTTSEKVVDGSTFYCSDTSKLYVYCTDDWYERLPLGGGGTTYTAGTGIDITDDTISVDTSTIQEKLTAGTGIDITDNVISASGGGNQYNTYSSVNTSNKANGGAIYLGNLDATQTQQTDPSTIDLHYKYFWALPYKNSSIPSSNSIVIGSEANDSISGSIAIGFNTSITTPSSIGIGAQYVRGAESVSVGINSKTEGPGGVAVGMGANISSSSVFGGVALGYRSSVSRTGEVNVGTSENSYGFNNSNYRIISGVYDGQSVHDAATVAQGNTLATTAPTTSTVGVLGQLYTDTTNMHTYQCTAISGDTYTWTQRW